MRRNFPVSYFTKSAADIDYAKAPIHRTSPQTGSCEVCIAPPFLSTAFAQLAAFSVTSEVRAQGTPDTGPERNAGMVANEAALILKVRSVQVGMSSRSLSDSGP